MATVRIAHLSDLHFVPGKRGLEVWGHVRDFINTRVRPQAILVTGDVTDSATHPEFEFAKACLDSLMVERPGQGGDRHKYRIVAGNHDRFLYRGNNPPFGLGRLSPRWWPKDKQGRFDHAFRGEVQITPSSHCDMTLYAPSTGVNQVEWNLRVIGLDSSASENWFAQGRVERADIGVACQAAAQAGDKDLVIALVHHHILPIPAVEARKSKLSGLVDATGMLNAGALIDGLSRSQVDLVLHGHEHASHQARFTGSGALATSVALLAAGSATGDETLQGWDIGRVHFNVIELDDDRSVWMREVGCVDDQIGYLPGRRLLLGAEDIRRSRFLRRTRNQDATSQQAVRRLPTSQLRKLVEFRLNRDIELTESRTDWQVSSPWIHHTRSGSGLVGEATVQFDWADGSVDVVPGIIARPEGSAPDLHRFAQELPNADSARLARRVTTRWIWSGAAVYTQEELAMLPNTARNGSRQQGREFASVLCPDEIESLVLSVRVPPQFAPSPRAVRVYVEPPDRADGQNKQVVSEDLLRGLQFCGPGNFELRVAYPLPGHRYGIDWPLQDLTQIVGARDARAGSPLAFAPPAVQKLAALMPGLLARWQPQEAMRWALYVADAAPGQRLVRQEVSGATGPQILPLSDARSLSRMAYWGDVVLAQPDENNHRYEVQEGERLLGYFAVRPLGPPIGPARILVRIAFTSNLGSRPAEYDWQAAFKAFAGHAGYELVATLGLGV